MRVARARQVRTGRARTISVARAALVIGAVSACSSNAHPAPGPTGIATGPGVHVADHVGSGVELVAKTGPRTRPDPGAAGPVARAEQAFTVALLRHLATSDGQNTSVSPASLGIALAMLQNGAAGQTRTQISHTLQATGIPVAAQDAGWAALAAGWRDAARAGGFTLQSANSIWVQRGLPMNKKFMADLARYYRTGVWQVDYARHADDAVSAINTWTSQHTHGKIDKLFDRLDPSTGLVLADAVLFRAAWQDPFDADDTMPGSFTRADGTTAPAKFMTKDGTSLPASVTSRYAAVQLPYRGGRFAALAIMPRSGSLHDFVDSLTQSALSQLTSGLSRQELSLRMPRFTTSSTLDLVDTLKSLGMTDAFSAADFSALSPKPLAVSQVTQRVYLSVAEKGTEAAAATGIGISAGAIAVPKLELNLDHPFLFLIRDTRTGAILFASEVQNPTAG